LGDRRLATRVSLRLSWSIAFVALASATPTWARAWCALAWTTPAAPGPARGHPPHSPGCLGLIEFCPKGGRVDLDQELARHHCLVVVDRHERHAPRTWGATRTMWTSMKASSVDSYWRASSTTMCHADRREPGHGGEKQRQDRSPPTARHFATR